MLGARGEIRGIPFASCRAFRAVFATHPGLVEDAWDHRADHFGIFLEAHLIGTFRVVYACDGRLPINEHFPDLPADVPDRQIGRLVSSPHSRSAESSILLFRYYNEHFLTCCGRIYVANSGRSPISTRRYQSLGFVDTGRRYADDRYPGELHVLVKEPPSADIEVDRPA